MFKHRSIWLLAVATAICSAGCSSDPVGPDSQVTAELWAELAMLGAVPDEAQWSRSSVFELADEAGNINQSAAAGVSLLARVDQGVAALVSTDQLEIGSAVTVWWVVYNNPDECLVTCSLDDLTNPAVQGDLVYLDGFVVDRTGEAEIRAVLRTDAIGQSIATEFGIGDPRGISNTAKAEVHLVVRSHGQMIPALAHEMLTTFGGGCNNSSAALGTPGPNTCVNLRAAVHAPPARRQNPGGEGTIFVPGTELEPVA